MEFNLISGSLLTVGNLIVDINTREESAIRAVNGLSFTVERGRTLGIVGESGSGKTITALTIMGLLKSNAVVTADSILFDAMNLLSMDWKARSRINGKRIAMIFQEPMASLNPLMKIGRQVGENAWFHHGLKGKMLKELVLQTMADAGLKDGEKAYHMYPHQLSGGMRQRAMIASAVICKPDLLIADEPTTALDVTIQSQILDLLGSYKDRGMSMIFISHDFGVISRISDDILVMYEGYGVEYGARGQIMKSPCHPYTRGLISSIPSEGKKGRRLYQIPWANAGAGYRGCPFGPRCEYRAQACMEAVPPLDPGEGGRLVRCIRYKELVM